MHTAISQTGFEEVVVDGVTGLSPVCFSTDCGYLAVQPGSRVWGVVRRVFRQDIVDVPVANKGGKYVGIAGSLSLTTSRIGSATGTFEDLVGRRVNKARGREETNRTWSLHPPDE